jgi:choline dehydrogenase
MGPDPAAGAVVDSRGAVHGVEGLLVADASVMPDVPAANTSLPVIMVAERLAAWMAACGDA